ncbi:hypothetical protein FQV37_2656 [Psychrobacter nivimaris]|uniref:Uncharacterized protein n=1 Tax=Psychrobacter nivimaris TaxID=281738 RepID=A0A6N7C0B4_9GAMM|nr:hypothetical protein FQV37_2656 [Psychrobacter nivimaris]
MQILRVIGQSGVGLIRIQGLRGKIANPSQSWKLFFDKDC